MEKYIPFSLGNLRFIDSFQFLLSSLDSLVASNKPDDFEIMKQFEEDDERRALILRKGVYPYEYMDSFEKFNETSLQPSTANYQTHIYLIMTTNKPRKSGKPMNARRWATTTTSTSQQTHSFSQMCLRTSERHA